MVARVIVRRKRQILLDAEAESSLRMAVFHEVMAGATYVTVDPSASNLITRVREMVKEDIKRLKHLFVDDGLRADPDNAVIFKLFNSYHVYS